MHAAQLSPVHAAARRRRFGAPREAVLRALEAEGIPCSAGYGCSLHHQPLFRNKAFGPFLARASARLDYRAARCPNSDLLCREQAIWLEQRLFLGSKADMDDIASAFEKVYEQRRLAERRGRSMLNVRVLRALKALSENTYLSAVRAGMVAVVPLTIVGGLFLIVAYLPFPGWEARIAPYLPLLQVPVTATFGLLAVVACFSIAYDLGKRLQQEPLVSATLATVTFLMLQLDLPELTVAMDGLGSKGLFTAILVAIVAVRVQKLFDRPQLVVRMPASVPPIVAQSFLSLVPLLVLIVLFWQHPVRARHRHQPRRADAVQPAGVRAEHAAGHPGLRAARHLLWSVGINGDNAVDAVVAPIFLQYLAANVDAMRPASRCPT